MAQSHQSPLLALPPELRIIIWDLALEDVDMIRVDGRTSGLGLSLLYACKQIPVEALQSLCASAVFHAGKGNHAFEFLTTISPMYRSLIQEFRYNTVMDTGSYMSRRPSPRDAQDLLDRLVGRLQAAGVRMKEGVLVVNLFPDKEGMCWSSRPATDPRFFSAGMGTHGEMAKAVDVDRATAKNSAKMRSSRAPSIDDPWGARAPVMLPAFAFLRLMVGE